MAAVAPVAVADPLSWALACPSCHAGLGPEDAIGPSVLCRCGRTWRRESGVLDFVPDDRRAAFDGFLASYTLVRRAEGRGSKEPAWYLALPDTAEDDPFAWQWRIRGISYRALLARVVSGLPAGARVLDLGAGTGWLSHRLAELGHRPCAVDVTLDDVDGLVAARHYPERFPRLRADFDHLPLPNASADLAVFNASFHYSVDYDATLAEVLRVLAPGGAIVVLDSPIYGRDESGRRMVAEKHAGFEKRFGTRSDSLPSREYLTWAMLGELGRRHGLSFQARKPWYGLAWAMSPWKARLRGRREPSRFALLVARRIG